MGITAGTRAGADYETTDLAATFGDGGNGSQLGGFLLLLLVTVLGIHHLVVDQTQFDLAQGDHGRLVVLFVDQGILALCTAI